MNKVQRYVSYVVGTFLVFPLRVIHILPPEEKVKKTKASAKKSAVPVQSDERDMRTQQGVKRCCGQAQKSARIKYQQRTQKVKN